MTLDQLFTLLEHARKLSHHRDYVVVGSNSVLALAEHMEIPADMALSIDVDSYLRDDPGRTGELIKALGEGSVFHRREGFYLDAVSPQLPTLPEGWEGRLIKLEKGGNRAWFLDPNDAAISKYARGEPRDQRWIRAGLRAGILSMARLRLLAKGTVFLDAAEQKHALRQMDEDAAWLASGGRVGS